LRAARATFALNAAVWLRRGRRVIFAPLSCHLNGWLGAGFSTYTLVRLSEASSVILSYYEVPEETLTTAKMKLAYTSPKGAFWQFEDLHVYIANDSADSGTVLAKNGGE